MVKSTEKSLRLRRDNDLAVSSSNPSSGGSICSLAMLCLISGNELLVTRHNTSEKRTVVIDLNGNSSKVMESNDSFLLKVAQI